jgi:dTDP-glucose pyrophosphorylase
MKAIILAAGYATRLQPLTLTLAKPLLPLAGRPIVDYIYDKIAEVADIDAIHVVAREEIDPPPAAAMATDPQSTTVRRAAVGEDTSAVSAAARPLPISPRTGQCR